MINSPKIKGRIVEMEKTQKECADMLNISTPTLCQKLNNVRPMTLQQAEDLAKYLGIRDQEFADYFFAESKQLKDLKSAAA